MPVFLGLLYKWIWFELNNYYLSKLMEALLFSMQKLDTNCKQGILLVSWSVVSLNTWLYHVNKYFWKENVKKGTELCIQIT